MNSFLAWVNEVPINWKVVPLKAVSTYCVSSVDKIQKEKEDSVLLCNYTDVYNNDFITKDIPFMNGTVTFDELQKFSIKKDDILITKDSESWDDIGIPAIVVEEFTNLVCGYHLAIIRPDKDKILPQFLFRCLQAKGIRIQLELSSTGVTRYGLPKDAIGTLKIPIPNINDQEIISTFIDRETNRIDQLINFKERLIKLISEKRQVLISQIITKGLNPQVNMRDSGIEWLEEIPIHWELKKIKHITTKVGSGVTPKGGADVYIKEGIPILRSQNIHFDGLKLDDVAFISSAIHFSMSNSKVQKGDVLLNITGASIGRCFYFEEQFPEANVNQHVCILRSNEKVLFRYLYLFMCSDIAQFQIKMSQVGGGREGLNFESLKSFTIPLPSINEQQEIIEKIELLNSKLKSIEELTRNSIDLLKEKRSSLITAAVTGQIEMPTEV